MVDGVRQLLGRARRAGGGGDRRRPASSTAWWRSTRPDRWSDRPSSGTTPSRRPTPAGCWSSWMGAPRRGRRPAAACPVAAFTVTKLSWLHRSEPEHWARVAKVLLPHDWLTYRLTGGSPPTGATPRAPATGRPPTGVYRWDLLRIVDAERDWYPAVPEVLGPLDDAGVWHAAVVAPGTGDNMAAALGLGAADRRRRGVARAPRARSTAVSDAPDRRPDRRRGRLRRRHRPVPPARLHAQRHEGDRGGARPARWSTTRRSTSLALRRLPARAALTLLPYLDGERTPDRPDATGVLAGLRSDVTRAQLARAAFEGVVCGLLDAYDALAALVPAGGRLLLTGGGARSAVYRQLLADLSGRAVTDRRRRRGRGHRCLRAGRVGAPPARGRRRGGGVGPAAVATWSSQARRVGRRPTCGRVPRPPRSGGLTARWPAPVAGRPFAVLGVPRSADADALRGARRRLALDEHPDRGGSADAHAGHQRGLRGGDDAWSWPTGGRGRRRHRLAAVRSPPRPRRLTRGPPAWRSPGASGTTRRS